MGTVVVTALTKRPSYVAVVRGEGLTGGTRAEVKVAEEEVEVGLVPKKAGTPATAVACDMAAFPTAD